MSQTYFIPATEGIGFIVKKGQTIRVIDVEGEQVADFVAYQLQDPSERLDPSVTMDAQQLYLVGEKDLLYTNKYRPMFTITRDLVECHDLLNSSCRSEMYEFLYGKKSHRSCHENLDQALRPFGIASPDQYYAFNIFMHTVVTPDGKMSVKRPKSKPGDYIEMRAEMDAIVAISACPCEESVVNGFQCTPLRVEVE